MGLADIHGCDHATTIKLAAYLADTAVPAFASELRSGRSQADRASVPAREDLGHLLSIFANLGGIRAMPETGRPTFLVGEVQAVLALSECTDTDSRSRLAALVASVRAGRLTDRTLTAARTDGGLVLSMATSVRSRSTKLWDRRPCGSRSTCLKEWWESSRYRACLRDASRTSRASVA